MRYRVYLDDDTEGVPIRVQDTEGDKETFYMTLPEAAALAGALETAVTIAQEDEEE